MNANYLWSWLKYFIAIEPRSGIQAHTAKIGRSRSPYSSFDEVGVYLNICQRGKRPARQR